MSGNARVFKTGTPGQLGHLTMNLVISDHIIGKFLFFKYFTDGLKLNFNVIHSVDL